jgi:excisionase family DNA binding protein
MTDRLLTIPEACARLRIGRATLYARISDGLIPALKIGSATRLRESDIDKVIATAPRLGPAPSQSAAEG